MATVRLEDWLEEPVYLPRPKRRPLYRSDLQPLKGKGWQTYTATVEKFGVNIEDGGHFHTNVLLKNIQGAGLEIEHCWLRYRPKRWGRVLEGDVIEFRANVTTYKKHRGLAYSLTRPKNIKVLKNEPKKRSR